MSEFDVTNWLRYTWGLDDNDCLSAGTVSELCEDLLHAIREFDKEQ